MRPIHLRLTSTVDGARTYRFHAYEADGLKSLGWALVTVNDATGELIICSDWGNWVHLWGPSPEHLGARNLTEFIAGRGDAHYLVDKLVGKSDGREFSPTKTTEAFVERLIEVRRDHIATYGRNPDLRDDGTHRFGHGHGIGYRKRKYLTHDLFTEICEGLRSNEDVGTGDTAAALYLERLPDAIHDFIDTAYEYCATEETWESKTLRSVIVPAVIEACRGETLRRFRELGSVAQLLEAALEGARTKAYRHSLPLCPCGPVKCNTECRGASRFAVGQRCAYWGSLCGGDRSQDPHGSHTDQERQANNRVRPNHCANMSPAGYTGHWRDWHRGHGCHLDPDRQTAPAPAAPAPAGGSS